MPWVLWDHPVVTPEQLITRGGSPCSQFFSPHTLFILPCHIWFVFSHVGRFPEWESHRGSVLCVLMGHGVLWNQEWWLCAGLWILLEMVPGILAGGNPKEAPANVVGTLAATRRGSAWENVLWKLLKYFSSLSPLSFLLPSSHFA